MKNKNSCEVEINHEYKYIYYKYKRRIVLPELKEVWENLISKKEFNNYNIISDFTKATYDFSIRDTDSLWEYLDAIKDMLYNKKIAIIVDDIDTTVISLFVQIKAQSMYKFYIKTFSDVSAAEYWVSY